MRQKKIKRNSNISHTRGNLQDVVRETFSLLTCGAHTHTHTPLSPILPFTPPPSPSPPSSTFHLPRTTHPPSGLLRTKEEPLTIEEKNKKDDSRYTPSPSPPPAPTSFHPPLPDLPALADIIAACKHLSSHPRRGGGGGFFFCRSKKGCFAVLTRQIFLYIYF